MMKATGFWAAARNAVLKVIAFWVLLFAAYLAIGRQFFPYIEQLKPEVETWLSTQLGTSVSIGSLQGEWVRFNPVVHLKEVQVGGGLTVSEMTLAPGIYESISRGGLSFIRFELTDFAADIIETKKGWQITGLETNSSERSAIDLNYIFNLLGRQQEVTFTNTQLNITPLSLPSFRLTLENGRLNGNDTSNGLVANAVLTANSVDIPISLQIETSLNAMGLNRIYLKHGEIDLAPWMTSFSAPVDHAVIAGEYWLDLEGDKWKSVTARLSSTNIELKGQYASIVLDNSKVETHFENKGNGFEAWLNILEYRLNGKQFGSTQVKADRRAGRVFAQWDSLPAEFVGHWFALNDKNGFWHGISPSGYLEQGSLTLNESDFNSIKLQASVADFSLHEHESVPGLTNLNGAILMEGVSGEMTLSASESLFQLPSVFDRSFNVDVPETTLRWDMSAKNGMFAKGTGRVNIHPNSVNDHQAALPVDVFWQSISPTSEQRMQGRDASVELNISVNQMDEYWLKRLSRNTFVDSSVADELDSLIVKSEFSNVRLDYLASFSQQHENDSQIFISGDFKEADVKFLDSWQSLSNVSGSAQLDKQGVKVTAKGAYSDLDIQKIDMFLDFDQYALSLALDSDMDSASGLEFLQTGPLSEQYNEGYLEDWRFNGQAKVFVTIDLPLSDPNEFKAHVEAQLLENNVSFQDIDLDFERVNGVVVYDTVEGLATKNLTLEHLGLPQSADVTGNFSGLLPVIDIKVQGSTDVAYWGDRLGDKFMASQNATIHHDTDIVIKGRNVQLTSKSDLVGLALQLPKPLFKEASQVLPVQLSVEWDQRNWTLIRGEVGSTVSTYFELNQNKEVQRGAVALNTDINVRAEKGVYFDLVDDQIDGDLWWDAIQQLRTMYQNSSDSEVAIQLDSLIRAIHVSAKSINYMAQPWTNVEMDMLSSDRSWIVSFTSDEGQGQVLVPKDDAPLFVDLQWLARETVEQQDVPFENIADPLLDYNPSDVPDMQVQINKFIWNERDLGSWRGEITTDNNTLTVNNLVGNMQGALLKGKLVWQKQNDKHETKFVGDIELGNILDVLNTWQYAPVLTSRSGDVAVDAYWQGSPAHFDFKRLQGAIELTLNKGAILKVEEYEGIKLVGLLNFTRVIQRVALDFSDLLDSGITFDTVEGELLFDRGFARVGEKLVIDGSATKFRFTGDADLLSDTLDIDMVLTVPLSSTFPLVALLAGVTPQAAAAIYVTERMFNNELERISSARMHITGSFEEPETKFYRVFNAGSSENPPALVEPTNSPTPNGDVQQ